MVGSSTARYLFGACLCASMVDLFVVDLVVAPLALGDKGAAASPLPIAGDTPSPSGSVAVLAAAPDPPSAPSAARTGSVVDPSARAVRPGSYGTLRQGSYPAGIVARFESDQAAASTDDLPALAKAMLADPRTRIVLEGHADPSGDRSHNRTLSLDRARWAQARLVELGVSPMRIEIVGHGAERLLVEGDDDAAVAMNRRVEFRWLPSPPSDEQADR